mmetsp:Transcript_28701/g.46824  ORF Transcript_28701/g.46824 Transcript_28701/m.46824 type:complete len:86 (+) Transcript_28701:409-666(+)
MKRFYIFHCIGKVVTRFQIKMANSMAQFESFYDKGKRRVKSSHLFFTRMGVCPLWSWMKTKFSIVHAQWHTRTRSQLHTWFLLQC